MSAFGKRCLKYENDFAFAAAASFVASGDFIHLNSESIESCSVVLGITFLRLNAPVEKKGGGGPTDRPPTSRPRFEFGLKPPENNLIFLCFAFFNYSLNKV